MKGITKSFPGVRALQDVSLEVRAGEVHALVGENGAGKSTLIRILGGIYPRDAGQILVRGVPVEVASRTHARQLGISIIHQELNQVPALSVAENIFLGREPRRLGGLVDWEEMYARAGRLLADLGVSIDPRRRLGTLTVAEQQLVEIAKALSADAAIVVMDEPTAPLTVEETERLFGFIRDLRARGVGIIYITHRLEEVFKIADRVTVLRDGLHVGTYAIAGLTMDELISLMVGRRLTEKFPKEDVPLGPPVLDVRGLTVQGFFRDVSFILRHGEILGIAGLIGSGTAEVAHAIFRATSLDAGEIMLDGRPVSLRSPAGAIALGIGLVTEDRKRLGLVLSMSVRANITLLIVRRMAVALFIRRLGETARITQAIRALHMAGDPPAPNMRNLSWGAPRKSAAAA